MWNQLNHRKIRRIEVEGTKPKQAPTRLILFPQNHGDFLGYRSPKVISNVPHDLGHGVQTQGHSEFRNSAKMCLALI